MSPKISLFADIHSDDELARNIQRSVEIQNPDVVMEEMICSDSSNLSSMVDAIQDYRTMADVYEAFGGSKQYQNPVISDTPLYALNEAQLSNLVGPVRNHVNENYSDAADRPNLPVEQQRALYAVERVEAAIEQDESTLTSRLIDSSQFMDADVFGIENREDRVEMFEYGAANIDNLPNNPKDVKEVVQNFRMGNPMKAQIIGSISQTIDYAKGCDQLLGEYDPIREQKMADFVKETMNENGYETAAVTVGGRHVEGIHQKLPDEWDVTDFYLAGEPSEWSAGKLHKDTISEKYHARK